MLQHTFRHLPGVGPKSEQKCWDAGVTTWRELIDCPDPAKTPLGGKFALARERLAQSIDRYAAKDAAWFGKHLMAGDMWRMLPDFGHAAAYVDIETTGLGPHGDHITTIALYDGRDVKHYVHGHNLKDFLDDIQAYSLLVTFNGRTFDAPFIEKSLQCKLDMAHLDLRCVFRAAGLKGGLKKLEKHFGLDRGGLDGVDGYWAVLLWREYDNTGDVRFLETLLAYNVEDVLSLQLLAVEAFNLLAKNNPLTAPLPMPQLGRNPFTAHNDVLHHIQETYFR